MVMTTKMMTITPPPAAPAIIAIITLPTSPASWERERSFFKSQVLLKYCETIGHTCWRWSFPLHLPSLYNHHGSYLKLSPSLHHSPARPARKQSTPSREVHLVVDNVLGGEALPRDIPGSRVERSNNHPLHLTCSDQRTQEVSWWTSTSTVSSTHQ